MCCHRTIQAKGGEEATLRTEPKDNKTTSLGISLTLDPTNPGAAPLIGADEGAGLGAGPATMVLGIARRQATSPAEQASSGHPSRYGRALRIAEQGRRPS